MWCHSRREVEKIDTTSCDCASAAAEGAARSERVRSRPSPSSESRVHQAVRTAGEGGASGYRNHRIEIVVFSYYISIFQRCAKSTSDRSF
jgi:hypothetical protein